MALNANESLWIIRCTALGTWHGQNWLIWWERPTPTCTLSGLWLIYNPPTPPPLIPTSPPHTPSLLPAPPLPLAVCLYPCHSPLAPPQRLMQSVTNPECFFPPIQTQRQCECCCWEGEFGGRFGRGGRVCILDVPILTWPPWGYTHDKHQISLTKTAVPQRRSWHGWGGISALQRPLMGISREGGSEEETKEASTAEVGVT